MVHDYLREMYEPIARQSNALAVDRYRRARELSAWKEKILDEWPSVKVVAVDSDAGQGTVDLGGARHVSVEVDLGGLGTADVAVELLHGPVVGGDELVETEVVPLSPSGRAPTASVAWLYRGSFRCERSGRHGYTVRIVPAHPDLASSMDLGCIAWA